jgi:hypothetical protein
VGGGVGLEDVVPDPPGAAAGRLGLEPRRDQPPDAAAPRVGVDAALHAAEVADLAHDAVTDDSTALDDHARVAREVDVGPLILEVGHRERARAVQRGLERDDDLGHRGRVGAHGSAGGGTFHAGRTVLTAAAGRARSRLAGEPGSLAVPGPSPEAD